MYLSKSLNVFLLIARCICPHFECIICALPPPTLASWRLASLQSSRAVPSLHTLEFLLLTWEKFHFLGLKLLAKILAGENRARILTISLCFCWDSWPCLLDSCRLSAAVWENLGNTGQHTTATQTIFIQPDKLPFSYFWGHMFHHIAVLKPPFSNFRFSDMW